MAADLKKISYVYEHKNRSTSTIKNTNQLADSKISNICEQKDRSTSTMKNTSKLADSKESNKLNVASPFATPAALGLP